MINLQLTNTQAIALHALISNLTLLSNPVFPEAYKKGLIEHHAEDLELQGVGDKVAIALDEVKRQQEEKAGFLAAVEGG